MVDLEPGPNRLTLKICGDDASQSAPCVWGAPDGAPDATLIFSNDLAQSQAFAKAFAKKKQSDKLLAQAGPEGPIQLFQKLTLGGAKKAAPAALKPSHVTWPIPAVTILPGTTPVIFAKQAADSAPTVRRAARRAPGRGSQSIWRMDQEGRSTRRARPAAQSRSALGARVGSPHEPQLA